MNLMNKYMRNTVLVTLLAAGTLTGCSHDSEEPKPIEYGRKMIVRLGNMGYENGTFAMSHSPTTTIIMNKVHPDSCVARVALNNNLLYDDSQNSSTILIRKGTQYQQITRKHYVDMMEKDPASFKFVSDSVMAKYDSLWSNIESRLK